MLHPLTVSKRKLEDFTKKKKKRKLEEKVMDQRLERVEEKVRALIEGRQQILKKLDVLSRLDIEELFERSGAAPSQANSEDGENPQTTTQNSTTKEEVTTHVEEQKLIRRTREEEAVGPWQLKDGFVFFKRRIYLPTNFQKTFQRIKTTFLQHVWDSESMKKKKEATDGDERWSNPPEQLMKIISQRLDLIDNIKLASISVSWRRVSLETARSCPPLLLFSCTPQTFSFSSLTDGMTYNIVEIHQANLRGTRVCNCSSEGWLLMLNDQVPKKKALLSFEKCFLLNPFSKARVKLPNPRSIQFLYSKKADSYIHPWEERTMFDSVICSSSPMNDVDNCIVVAFTRNRPLLFCRLGDKSWTAVSFPGLNFFSSNDSCAMFYKGQLHLFCRDGSDAKQRLCVIDFAARRKPKAKVCQVFKPDVEQLGEGHEEYLVESQGSLLLVYRYLRQHRYRYITSTFLVFKLEENDENDHPSGTTHVWVKQSRLERDQALFLGSSCSISLSAAKYPGLKSNTIYFADKWNPDLTVVDPFPTPVIGMYNLEYDWIDRSISFDVYTDSVPLIWIKPPV